MEGAILPLKLLYFGALRYKTTPNSPNITFGVQAATTGGMPACVAETDMSLALNT